MGNKNDHCAKKGSDKKCISCEDGYELSNGECKEKPKLCSNYSNGSCKSCISGYYLKNGECLKESSLCSYYSNGSCQSCISGYYLSNYGECLKATSLLDERPKFCEKLDSSNKNCLKCYDGYYGSQCIRCSEMCISGKCSQEKGCESCVFGFYPRNGNCTECPKHCKGCYKPVNETQLAEIGLTFCMNCTSLYKLDDLGECRLNIPQLCNYIFGIPAAFIIILVALCHLCRYCFCKKKKGDNKKIIANANDAITNSPNGQVVYMKNVNVIPYYAPGTK